MTGAAGSGYNAERKAEALIAHGHGLRLGYYDVLVTHDPGAIDALRPDRVLLLPDGVEDFWSDDYEDLVSLA